MEFCAVTYFPRRAANFPPKLNKTSLNLNLWCVYFVCLLFFFQNLINWNSCFLVRYEPVQTIKKQYNLFIQTQHISESTLQYNIKYLSDETSIIYLSKQLNIYQKH